VQKRKTDLSNRCVSRSKTVGGTPSRRINTDMLNMHKTIPKENLFRSDFEVHWPSASTNDSNREQTNLRQIRDTPVKANTRNSTPKRAVSTNRNLRRTSMIGVSYVAETPIAEPRPPISTNRRGSLDNRHHATPPIVKPRMYMAVSSPRKTINMKCAKQHPNNVTHSNNSLPKLDANFRNAFDGKTTKTTAAINSEPLDFSEFDTEDFSSSDDVNEGFSMPFKPVEPLYYTSSKNTPYFQSNNDDAEEEAWSALFSPPLVEDRIP
jgi:hypothetical protein